MKLKGLLKKLNVVEGDKNMKNFKTFFRRFFENKFFLVIFLGGFLLNLISWVFLGIGLDFDKTSLILHYNSFFGIDKISLNTESGRLLSVFFVSLGGLFIMLINYILGMLMFFISWKNLDRNVLKGFDLNKTSIAELGGYFLILAGLGLQITVLVYTVAIVLVNK